MRLSAIRVVTQCMLITADNRPQTTVCRQSTVHGSQPTYLNFKPYFQEDNQKKQNS
jgi:hypothetical protein